jgi:hypothetical protein
MGQGGRTDMGIPRGIGNHASITTGAMTVRRTAPTPDAGTDGADDDESSSAQAFTDRDTVRVRWAQR